jgi:hypothetical protein
MSDSTSSSRSKEGQHVKVDLESGRGRRSGEGEGGEQGRCLMLKMRDDPLSLRHIYHKWSCGGPRPRVTSGLPTERNVNYSLPVYPGIV